MFLSVVTYLGLLFTSTHFQNKAKLSVLNSWWLLNRGENNRKTFIETAKRWPRVLNRGLIYNLILRLFWDFDYWPLNRRWRLNRWPLNECFTVVDNYITGGAQQTIFLCIEHTYGVVFCLI